MKEKERYEWNSRFDEAIKDNQTGDIVNAVEVLNQQDKRIKELEKKLDNARQKDIIIRQNCRQGYIKDLEEMNNLREENQQLKQQLHDLPKKIVEDVRIKVKESIFVCGDNATEEDISYAIIYNSCLLDVRNILDTILKKYGV